MHHPQGMGSNAAVAFLCLSYFAYLEHMPLCVAIEPRTDFLKLGECDTPCSSQPLLDLVHRFPVAAQQLKHNELVRYPLLRPLSSGALKQGSMAVVHGSETPVKLRPSIERPRLHTHVPQSDYA